MRYFLFLIGIILFFGGCSLQTTVAPVKMYRLNAPLDTEHYGSKGCQDKIIRIALLEGTNILRRQSIYYSDDDSGHYSYTRARWSENPSSQILNLFERSISANGLFKGVIPYKSQAKNQWLLENNIHEFMQVIKKDGTSDIYLKMDLTLVDEYSKEVLSVKKIALSKIGVDANVKSAVLAFNELIERSLDLTNVWLDETCR